MERSRRTNWLVLGWLAASVGCAQATGVPDVSAAGAQLQAADEAYPTEPATTVDEVVERLGAIVEHAKRRGDRLGYFAALYRQVTVQVQRGVQRGEFEDGPRMSRFDAAFGNRYFEALEAWQSGGRPPDCWQLAFDLAEDDDAIILQHILLGVNAHIDLDLAFATAETSPGRKIYALQRDYERINDILVEVLDAVQSAMNSVSPAMDILDRVGGRSDEQILDFSIRASRAVAWQNAVLLANTPPRSHAFLERSLDAQATALGALIATPGGVLGDAIREIRAHESQDTAAVIERLNAAFE